MPSSNPASRTAVLKDMNLLTELLANLEADDDRLARTPLLEHGFHKVPVCIVSAL